MISVFSNYLSPLIEAKKYNLTEPTKPSEIYNQLRDAYNQGVEGILDNTRFVAPICEGEECYDIVYKIWESNDLQKLVRWINKKIVLAIGVTDFRAIEVRVRIATNMLNKLVDEGVLDKIMATRIHFYLAKNVRMELSAINTEDLPF